MNSSRPAKSLKPRLNVRIHAELLAILQATAKHRGVDIAQLVEQALDAALIGTPRSSQLETRLVQHLDQATLIDQKLDALAEFIAQATRPYGS